MKTTILSVSAMLWSVIQVQAQIGGAVPTPPTVPTPPASAYSHIGQNNHVSTNRYTHTTNGKTEVYTETYTSNLPETMQDDPQRTKTFSKSYGIGRNDKINIANVYGSITFKIWEKNEIKVDADIKAWANSDEEAQKLIDDVNVTSSKNGDEVVFKASFADKQGNWGRGLAKGKKWRREVKIYMVVYMPASNPLTASQQYGNINMEDYTGPTSLKVQYGNLTTGNLNSTNNYILVQYGKAILKDVKAAKIKVQYGSGLTISDIDELELEAQYTSVNIASIKKSANIKHQYGRGVTIGYAGNLNLTAQYASVKLGRLAGTLTTKVQYGSLTIDQIETASRTVNVDADYSSVTLGFGAGYGADFSVNTSYGGFKYGDNVSAKRVDDDKNYSSSKAYNGTIGRGGSSTVKVDAQYGSVVFK